MLVSCLGRTIFQTLQRNERSHHSPDVADDLLNEGGRRIWPERGVGGRVVLALKVSMRRRHDAVSYTERLGLTLQRYWQI